MRIVYVAFIGLMVLGCGKKVPSTANTDNKDTNTVAADSSKLLSFEVDTFHVVETEKGCPKDECTTVDIYYEKIKNPSKAVHDSVNSYVQEFMQMALMDLGYTEGEIDLKKLSKDFIAMSNDPDLDMGGSWFWEHSTQIYQPVNEIIAVNSGFGGYTGGAHGNYTIATTNFFISNGKEVTMADLFTDIQALNKLAVKYFKRDNDLDESIDLRDHGWDVGDDDFALNENFDITVDAITWNFNQYEIGPYAAGAPSVKIPVKDIKHLMKISFTEVIIQ